ncbi:MAG: zinc ribbon domain-containing protein, partial [Candidatus Latescibacteria bacterium]|nr:zinc ribbon domain-containing protein [Candidatus Latescibacterota bacterium]
FSGQKPLDSILREMPEFWQRLPVRFFLKNLDFNDTKALIQFRLERVGIQEDIFTNDAFDGIYNYSEGCPRIICSVADLCLVIGFAKGMRRIGFVEVSTACRDMESSGDGFHYYAYIKSQQYNLFQDPEEIEKPTTGKPVTAPKTVKKSLKEGKKSVTAQSSKQILDIHSVSCPKCAEANPKGQKFCSKCDSPLYRKCPVCSSLIDTVSNVCPVCKADIVVEKNKLLDRLMHELADYDVLAEGTSVWLEAKGIELLNNERIIVIFPKGNALSGGPIASSTSRLRSSPKEACDFILTDERLILSIRNQPVFSELCRIDSCMLIDTGKFLGRRHVLMVSFNSDMYRITLPFGSRKNKSIMNSISSFIRQVMLK